MKINNNRLMLRMVPLTLVAILGLGACADMSRQELGTATGGAIGHEATERK